jgi:ribosomal protein L30E
VVEAVTKRLFVRAARRPVNVETGLADLVETLLVAHCRDLLGFARRAGDAAMGFVRVERLLASNQAALLLSASDSSEGGRRKLRASARDVPEYDRMTAVELGAAFGRAHVVHVAVRKGPLAKALTVEMNRLAGFRPMPSR